MAVSSTTESIERLVSQSVFLSFFYGQSRAVSSPFFFDVSSSSQERGFSALSLKVLGITAVSFDFPFQSMMNNGHREEMNVM